MKRMVVIVASGLTLAGCASWSVGDLFSGFGGPTTGELSLASDPPGAEARTSTGQICRTPCKLILPYNSGDFTVTFNVPDKGLPSGWKRDFLLHNVGWDKDNDLNVVTSQAVEPLPFHGMSGYPYRADEQFPETPRHREYLRKYQTRTQQPVEFWRQTQRFGERE